MKNKFYKLFRLFLSFIIAGSILTPNYAFGLSLNSEQASFNFSEPVTKEVSLMRVVSAKSEASVVVSQDSGNKFSKIVSTAVCSTAVGNNDLVQGFSGISLHQPANCFALTNTVAEPLAVKQLSVLPSVRNQTVVVVAEQAKIAAFSFTPPVPQVQKQAIMPIVTSFALLTSFTAMRRLKMSNFSLSFVASDEYKNVSLTQLQVFRC